ncbi:MBL fold metallo-hydrolase [Nocardia australiensis]|uniref:MBL fold metallo-hydrolase n=1 Tax=Nocardia australiensis TaxID=2887191 RepID=UPI001D132BC0|nr:MBL fold metallo-hydrolase [Nocardia australiensis]
MITLADDIHVLRARSTHWPSPSNVVVIEDGDGLTLLDCGFGTEEARDGLDRALRTLGYEIGAVHTVVVTHPHLDHAGGIGLLPERVRVLGPTGLGETVADAVASAELIFPTAVRALAPERADLEIVEHFRTDCGVLDGPVEVTALVPGEDVNIGRTSWQVVLTPGHADGMYSYVESNLGIVVCSDVLVARGTSIPWYAPGGGGTRGYLGGLGRLAELDLQLAIPGHGGMIYGADNCSAAIIKTSERIERRTDAVMRALDAGPLSFAELEAEIYPQRVYDVIPWAASVLATHLLEGIEDGALHRHDDVFSTTA